MPTTPPSITTLPAAPDPNNRTTFNTLAYPWSAALPTFGTQVSAVATNVKANADEAVAQVALAATQATNAATSALLAADQVTLATTQASTSTTQAGIATTKAGEASASAAAVAAAIAAGPVLSVNGRTGLVTGVQDTLVSGTSIKTINSTSLLGSGNIVTGSSMIRSARSTNTILGVADSTTLIDYTSGTFTQTLAAAATLGSGWYCWLKNSGTGVITVDPNASETIGGATTAALNPGDLWIISSDGTNIQLQRLQGMNSQIYTSGSGNFTIPAGVEQIYVECWGGGGGVNRTSGKAGGGGGGYVAGWVNTTPAANLAYAVGAGGISGGGSGGSSTFGGVFTASGGQGVGDSYGTGGAASGGSVNIPGGQAGGSSTSFVVGGAAYGTPAAIGRDSTDVPGNFPGGGGAAAVTGCAGGSGQIIIRWA